MDFHPDRLPTPLTVFHPSISELCASIPSTIMDIGVTCLLKLRPLILEPQLNTFLKVNLLENKFRFVAKMQR